MKAVINNDLWLPNLLEEIFSEGRNLAPREQHNFTAPAVNITENSSTFVVEFAAPGMKKEDFSITLEKDTLMVEAKSQTEHIEENSEQEETLKYRRREFNYSQFKRSFKLSEDINSDEIKAVYEDGILKITLPKMENKKALKRMVEVS